MGRRGGSIAFVMIVLGALTLDASASLVSDTRWEVVDLGPLTGQTFSAGTAVSNTGYVAGLGSNGTTVMKGFSWRADTGLRLLAQPAGTSQSGPDAVNDAGQLVGTAFTGAGAGRGVLWNADTSVNFVFQSAGVDQPTGLNNAGLVSGYRNALASQSAYVWNNGTYTDIGWPAPATSSQGYDINNAGQVLGHLNAGTKFGAFSSAPAFFVWSPTGGFTTVITSSTFENIEALDLSNYGMAVGEGHWNGNSNSLPWKWTAATGFAALSTLPGAVTSGALAVNDTGLIVGRSGLFGTIWDEQGAIFKADSLLAPAYTGWKVTSLRGINNDGWLTGEALPPSSSNSHAVLLRPLTAIPEPASAGGLILLLSCASLLSRRRP
jgi:uncharacterized membrane protein